MNVESAEASLAYTYAWWLTGNERAARTAVLAAVDRPDVPGADAHLRMEILLRRVRAAAINTPTMCPASELALLHDAIGIGLDSAAGLAAIDAREARTELAHGRLEALGPDAVFTITQPERLGGLAVGNPSDVAAARQNPELGRLREMILTGRDEVVELSRIDVPADLLERIEARQNSGAIDSEPLEEDWFTQPLPGGDDPAVSPPSQDVEAEVTQPADPVDTDADTDRPIPVNDVEGRHDEPLDLDVVASEIDLGVGGGDTDTENGQMPIADTLAPTGDTDHLSYADSIFPATDDPTADADSAQETAAVAADRVDGRNPVETPVALSDPDLPASDGEESLEESQTETIDLRQDGDDVLPAPASKSRRGWLLGLLVILLLLGVAAFVAGGRSDDSEQPVVDPADQPSEPAGAAVSGPAQGPGLDQPAANESVATPTPTEDAEPTPPDDAPADEAFVLLQAGVAVGIGSDPDFENPTTDPFDPISFTIEYSEAQEGDALVADWTVDDAPFDTERADLSPELMASRFTKQVPQDGWPVGQHILVFTLERTGEVVGQATFNVVAAEPSPSEG